MASLFQALLVLLTMLFLVSFFTDLSEAVLGAIVIAAMLPFLEASGMVEMVGREVVKLMRSD